MTFCWVPGHPTRSILMSYQTFGASIWAAHPLKLLQPGSPPAFLLMAWMTPKHLPSKSTMGKANKCRVTYLSRLVRGADPYQTESLSQTWEAKIPKSLSFYTEGTEKVCQMCVHMLYM